MTAPVGWVTLDDLKNDVNLDGQITGRDDQALQRCLDAAVWWVQRHRPELDYHGAYTVPPDVRLGTLRLAARWFVRRNSPDGLVNFGELGSGSVPRVDTDIMMLLGVLPSFG